MKIDKIKLKRNVNDLVRYCYPHSCGYIMIILSASPASGL